MKKVVGFDSIAQLKKAQSRPFNHLNFLVSLMSSTIPLHLVPTLLMSNTGNSDSLSCASSANANSPLEEAEWRQKILIQNCVFFLLKKAQLHPTRKLMTKSCLKFPFRRSN